VWCQYGEGSALEHCFNDRVVCNAGLNCIEMTLFLGADPGSRSASPACERDWMIRAATWRSSILLAERYCPQWLVWENVPGVLSSNGGRDFGAFVGALGQLGYGWAYRIFDAQYFGVPQLRRRVFVVGHLRAWQPAAAVLFELQSMRGDPPPRRKAGEKLPDALQLMLEGTTSTAVG
jgi:C-5 cytosine-specific DNA methylase